MSNATIIIGNKQGIGVGLTSKEMYYWSVKPNVVLVLFSSFQVTKHDWVYFCSSLVSENE